MADGYAQATHNASFVNLHSAAGVGHAMGNIFTAYRNRTPMVITAGQQSRSLLQMEPFLFSTQATELPRPYVKWACEPARAEDVPAAIARAYYIACLPPCGPTFVSIPVDDWDVQTAPVPARKVSTSMRAEASQIDALAVVLRNSQRPVFVIGGGVDREGGWEMLLQLAERHGALVWASPLIGRCGFPENHPLFAGFLPAFREEICARLQPHDVCVAIGAPVFTYHAEGVGDYTPAGLDVWQLTDDPDWAACAITGTAIYTSLAPALRDLLDRPGPATPAAQHGRAAPARLLRTRGAGRGLYSSGRGVPVHGACTRVRYRSVSRQLPDADAGRRAQRRQHHCRRSTQQSRADAGLPAHHAKRNLLHLQQRWLGAWSAGSGGCGIG
jgi:benzoylformate decarboxylase